jgi:hypothetical protein
MKSGQELPVGVVFGSDCIKNAEQKLEELLGNIQGGLWVVSIAADFDWLLEVLFFSGRGIKGGRQSFRSSFFGTFKSWLVSYIFFSNQSLLVSLTG